MNGRPWMSLAVATTAALIGLVAPSGHVRAAPPSSDVVLAGPCESAPPGAWTVIEEASGAGEGNLVCNYRLAGDGGGDEGGAAITINWYCTAAEASETWHGITDADRDTRIGERTDTELRILEGPLAPFPDNAHRDGVDSSFFPGVIFTWFEKSWLRLNDQVIATVVVISGKAPEIPEDGDHWTDVPRVDIDPIIAEARNLAASQVPDLATCSIPAVAPSGNSAPGGPGHDHPNVVLIAGGTAVAVGTVVVTLRRRRPARQVPGSPTASQVPPRCADLDRQYTRARERVLVLMDAEAQVHPLVDKALAVQRRNLATAKLALGFDAGRLIGGALAAVPLQQPGLVLRGTSPGAARPQWDTWRPPSNLPAALTAPARTLATAASAASNRVAALRRQLANVASHPQLRLLRDRLVASERFLADRRADLIGSQIARRDLARVNEQIARRHDQIARAASRIAELEANIGALNEFRTRSGMKQAIRRDMRRTIDLIREAQTAAAEARDALPGLTSTRRSLAADLAGFGNLGRDDLQRMIDSHGALARELAAAEANVTESLQRRLATAVAEEELAASAIESAMEQARRTASEHDTFGRAALRTTTAAVSWVTYPLWGPMAWLAEHTYGSRQSPQEIMQILNQGAQRVTELSTAQHVIERALQQRRGTLEVLHRQLAQCVGATSAPAPQEEEHHAATP